MTDKTYSEKEIREAIVKAGVGEFTGVVITELNRPKVTISDGEVYAYRFKTQWDYCRAPQHPCIDEPEFRKLTHSEHSAELRELVEAVKKVTGTMFDPYQKPLTLLNAALAAYRAAHCPDEDLK